MIGWSVRRLEKIGKIEVLCRSAAALHQLKAYAEGIHSSDVYPSFHPDLGYALFVFDTRPEVEAWLRQYAEAAPIAPAVASPPPPTRRPRRVRAAEFSAAALLLIAFGGFFLWLSPRLVRADVMPPVAVELPPVEESIEPVITVTDALAGFVSETIVVAGETSPPSAIAESAPAAPARDAVPAGQLKLWFVDVGQGDGIIIRLPDGGVVVVDANRRGAAAMIPILESLGVTTLRAVVMTHPHADHLGDLERILERFPAETFYDPGVVHPTAGYMNLLRTVEKRATRYVVPTPGERLDWGRGVTVTVLNAGGVTEINGNSIVLRIAFGRTAVLLTGDAEKEAEERMLARFADRLAADLLKVGHHGSRTSTRPEFLRAVSPKFAVISCGAGNTYGHPTPQTLRNLEAIRARIFRTDLDGTILAVSDGRAFTVRPLR